MKKNTNINPQKRKYIDGELDDVQDFSPHLESQDSQSNRKWFISSVFIPLLAVVITAIATLFATDYIRVTQINGVTVIQIGRSTPSPLATAVPVPTYTSTATQVPTFVIIDEFSTRAFLATSTPTVISPVPTFTHVPLTTSTVTLIPTVIAIIPSDTATPLSCSRIRPEGWVNYTVQQGATLSWIASNSGSTTAELQQVNCLDGTNIFYGTILYIPRLPPTPSPTSTSTPPPAPTITPKKECVVYLDSPTGGISQITVPSDVIAGTDPLLIPWPDVLDAGVSNGQLDWLGGMISGQILLGFWHYTDGGGLGFFSIAINNSWQTDGISPTNCPDTVRAPGWNPPGED